MIGALDECETQKALHTTALDSLRFPKDGSKRDELYRHIASSEIPTSDLVVALRKLQLLVHRSI